MWWVGDVESIGVLAGRGANQHDQRIGDAQFENWRQPSGELGPSVDHSGVPDAVPVVVAQVKFETKTLKQFISYFSFKR
jgi:hypothetical protein